MIVEITVDKVKDDVPNWPLRGCERTVVRYAFYDPEMYPAINARSYPGPYYMQRSARTIWHPGHQPLPLKWAKRKRKAATT